MSGDDSVGEFLAENGLSAETRLYRYTLPVHLSEDPQGATLISANTEPSEAVTDVYGGGHMALAQQIGPGLAFTETRENEWQAHGRVLVALRLGDAIENGARVYPVESVITDRVWYVTMPAGSLPVTPTDQGAAGER